MSKLQPKRKETDKISKSHVWRANPAMEKEFIDLCIESASLHGYQGSSLKCWVNVIKQLNASYNTSFDQKALKNKWNTLRGNYQVWRKLIHTTGHGRREDGSFDWPDEQWKAAIERDSKAAKFRYEPLRHFKEMEQLFEGTYAVGDLNTSYTDIKEEEVEVEIQNSEIEADVLPFEQTEVDLTSDDYFSAHLNTVSPGNVASSNPSPVVMPKLSEGLGGKRKRQVGDLDDITEILRQKFEIDKEEARKVNAYSMEECSKVLNAMKMLPEVNMDKKLLAKAKIKLCSNVEFRKTFLNEDTVEDKLIFLEALVE